MHACLLCWRPVALEQSAPALLSAFQESGFLALCQSKDKGQVHRILSSKAGKKGQHVFSRENADEAFQSPDGWRNRSIGHTRNLLQLASLSLGQQEIVFLDDDIFPEKGCEAAFSRLLPKYDLVPGFYLGCTGNGIYAMVHFFELLSSWSASPGQKAEAEQMLRGSVRMPQRQAKPHAVAGGLFGISRRLSCQACFFPTSYPFDDHFFEFCARHEFPALRFMGAAAAGAHLPEAEHCTIPGKEGKLVDNFILYIRSAIVENYAYFRLSGCLPKLVNGHHALVRASGFDAEKMCWEICGQSALDKFKSAAGHYLSLGLGEPIETQLRRLQAISEKELFVPQEELEAEWAAFEGEKEWFFSAKEKIQQGPARVCGKLFGE
jgi:hypothetical protein